MTLKLTTTADGSHSLLNETLNEQYHSRHGAIQESLHVFIDAAWRQSTQSEPAILEYGFGTGLNALLTAVEAEKDGKKVHYTSLENTVLNEEIWSALNYAEMLEHPEASQLYTAIHRAAWNEWVDITPYFSLYKCKTTFEDYIPEAKAFDLIYFDAFAPAYHPTAWQESVLQKCYNALKIGGIWVSYCAQGAVRRCLIQVGFTVEKIPGPPGKRQMLRGRVER